MRAIDTNVLVRFLTGDDPDQAALARSVIERGPVYVSSTVLLETAWVLRSVYSVAPGDIAAALRRFGGLANAVLDEPARIAQALDWVDQGLDVADALHLAKAVQCEALLTFDTRLIRAADGLIAIPVRHPD